MRDAVDHALAAAGYQAPDWYQTVKAGLMAALSTRWCDAEGVEDSEVVG